MRGANVKVMPRRRGSFGPRGGQAKLPLWLELLLIFIVGRVLVALFS